MDWKQDLKHLYSAKPEVARVTVPLLSYLAIDGTGDPNTNPAFAESVGALYTLAYTIKFMPRKGVEIPGYEPFRVGTLEGLWSFEGNRPVLSTEVAGISKDKFEWTMLILQPKFVTEAVLRQAQELSAKKGNPRLGAVQLRTIDEGDSLQILHLGPYADEARSVQQLEAYAAAQKLVFTGYHHEIYLSDPQRTAPEKLRTIVRHPVTTAPLGDA